MKKKGICRRGFATQKGTSNALDQEQRAIIIELWFVAKEIIAPERISFQADCTWKRGFSVLKRH